jgi:hypothetical protein
LLEICGESTGPLEATAPERQDWSRAPRAELLELLKRRNGFYGFASALHVRPLGGPSGQEAWNDPSGWRKDYEGAADGHWFFAEDAFGGQFSIRGDQLCSWDPETATAETLADAMAGWCNRMLDDHDFLTGHSLAVGWQEINGPLAAGDRLVPRTPFVLGGAYEADNLIAMNDQRGMRIRGQLWQHTKDLKPGTKFRFDLTD